MQNQSLENQSRPQDNTPHKRPGWWQTWVMKPNNWWLPLLLVVVVIGSGSLLFVGTRTYSEAPPMADFVTSTGDVVLTEKAIVRGQVVFLKYALMDYGSMFGDGAGRGPDFTADALHRTAQAMETFYLARNHDRGDIIYLRDAIRAQVQREIKENHYVPDTHRVELTAGQVYAYRTLVTHYRQFFRTEVADILPGLQRATDKELTDLAAFFFWGGWVCGTERPGHSYTYTNNWPYDPEAGNTPTSATVLWSAIAILGLIAGLGVVLFLHGRFSQLVGWQSKPRKEDPARLVSLANFSPTPVQRATYKFFLVAALLFVVQVTAGVLTVHNFLGLQTLFGIDVSKFIALTEARGWHLQLALLWVTASWVGVSFFLLSATAEEDPPGQVKLINILFVLFVVMLVGNLAGILLNPTEVFGEYWNLLGNQGWEFVEMGKLWQGMLLAILVLWSVILFRGIRPHWDRTRAWLLPNWLFYCVVAVSLLFLSGFVATPETNFVIADFWRWAVVHMWVEAFFEVFATIVVAYMMYLMGFISHNGASRVIYIATLLFLGSGLLGISHNFYWNAKPVSTLAVGSIFSTLQIVPLILLTLEAWQFRKKLPAKSLANADIDGHRNPQPFIQLEAFMFLLAVNFWNFFGAGLLGFLVNLPIINYYEHGTYLTVNHGHAAFMGVYGNLSLAAILFCSRYLLPSEVWNGRLLRRAFWSLNIGLMLMLMIDLFPVGFHQLSTVMESGFWFARSEAYIQSAVFQWLTWARIVGGLLFVLGGVVPFAWFMLSRYWARRGIVSDALPEALDTPPQELAPESVTP